MSVRYSALAAFAVATLVGALSGCGQSPPPASPQVQAESEMHNVDGWWCGEHGIPEDECAQCDVQLASRLKAAGDWCGLHEAPKSQCFACDPSLKAKFAARYEARYGKQPPQPDDAGAEQDHAHDS